MSSGCAATGIQPQKIIVRYACAQPVAIVINATHCGDWCRNTGAGFERGFLSGRKTGHKDRGSGAANRFILCVAGGSG